MCSDDFGTPEKKGTVSHFIKHWLRLQENINIFFLVFRVVEGMVTLGNLVSQMVNSKVLPTDAVEKVLYRQFRKIKLDTTLGRLARILEKDHFVLVVHPQRFCKC
jgi:hypothetical protein